MSVTKPYYLTVRPYTNGDYSSAGSSAYVEHPAYANNPSSYVRAFLLLQKDLQTLFEYVEPSEQNLQAYSFRTFELLLRACTEVEANFKAILRANTYSGRGNLTIEDYFKTDASHFLSQYEIRMPYWSGNGKIRKPFAAWAGGTHPLGWYQAYNNAKHDRAGNLAEATLEHVIDAISGLAVVLASQYYIYDFTPNGDYLMLDDADKFEGGIGGYLRVKFPESVPVADRYDFDWRSIESQADPFQKFNYNAV
jgi:hypothetical protein